MNQILLTCAIATVLMACLPSRNTATGGDVMDDSLLVAFYNVENLFDTLDNPLTDDADFLPTSKNEWNSAKYRTKLAHIAEVIQKMNYPDVMGLSEVENKAVLQDLVAQSALRNQGYKIVHFDSPDERGIDCALLYKSQKCELMSSLKHEVSLPENDLTRNILEVNLRKQGKGQVELTVFVNHWPSRTGGTEKSNPKRLAAAKVLQAALAGHDRWVAIGDFNDNPEDASLQLIKGGVNLAATACSDAQGTLTYKNQWDCFDQIIVSNSLAPIVSGGKSAIFHPDFITYFNKEAQQRYPNRTFSGSRYYGGYSDHFPVFTQLIW